MQLLDESLSRLRIVLIEQNPAYRPPHHLDISLLHDLCVVHIFDSMCCTSNVASIGSNRFFCENFVDKS